MRETIQETDQPTRSLSVVNVAARLSLMGMTAGLAAGLFEAYLLFNVPRTRGIGLPDAGPAIWFVAPLCGMATLGLLGLVLGLALRGVTQLAAYRPSLVLAFGIAAAASYTFATFALLRDKRPAQPVLEYVGPLLVFFVVVGSVAFLLLRATQWPAKFLVGESPGRGATYWKRTVLLSILPLLGGLGVSALRIASPSTTQATPQSGKAGRNIVLITLDAGRADHISAYGYDRPTTPRLDALAARGVLFENAIAASSWTLPSHASMLSGLLPHQHGANAAAPMAPDAVLLAEILASHGYETAGFNGNYFYGHAGWGIERGFETYFDGSTSLRYNLAATTLGRAVLQPAYERVVRFDMLPLHNAQEINQRVFSWFHHRSARPFFLFINYIDLHDPYQAPPPYSQRFGGAPDSLLRRVSLGAGLRLEEPLPSKDVAMVTAAYDNCLAFADDQLGRLVDLIVSSPAGKNTLFIVTADHGESLGEHGTVGHGSNLYREVIHVPLVVAGPGVPEGLRISKPAGADELFATILDLGLGAQLPLRRSSLARSWTPGSRPEAQHTGVISELGPVVPTPQAPASISLFTSEWHYIHDSLGRTELYHWPSDLQEVRNLSSFPEYQRIADLHRDMLLEYLTDSVRPWYGIGYLHATDQVEQSLLPALVMKRERFAPPPQGRVPIGAVQSLLSAQKLRQSARPRPLDEELLHSLPYQR